MSLVARMKALFGRSALSREIEDELNSHIEMRIADSVARGLSQDDARRDALLRFGNPTSIRERIAAIDTLLIFETISADFRFSIRQLRRSAGFTAAAILALALGVGASLVVFMCVDAVLIKPLPYAHPNSLVETTESSSMIPRNLTSYPNYLDWRRLNSTLSSLSAWTPTSHTAKMAAATDQASGARVTDNFFRTLGVTPQLGRDFYNGEDSAEALPSVLLSDGAWRKWFDGRKDAIGSQIILSDKAYTVIGVLPEDFYFAPRGLAQFWTPVGNLSAADRRRNYHNWFCVGLLKQRTSIGTARADLESIAASLAKQYPDSNAGNTARVVPLSDASYGNVTPIVKALFGFALLLLFIAGANVTSLLIVRSQRRSQEIAIRGALGASRGRLLSQFATEGVVVAVAGVSSGLLLAILTVRSMKAFVSEETLFDMPYLRGVHLTFHAMTFAGVVFLCLAGIFSVAPMVRLRSIRLQADLSIGTRTTRDPGWHRFISILVVLELAMAVVLLVNAGLLGKSLYRLLSVPLGFSPENLATLTVLSPTKRYGTPVLQSALEKRITEKVRELPGVLAVGVGHLPVSDNGPETWIRVLNAPFHGEHNEVGYRVMSPDFFKTINATMLKGRYFSESDDSGRPPVAIINKALAEKYFPAQDPLGKRIGNVDLSVVREIVGVVNNVREGSLDEDIWPALYVPFKQAPASGYSLVVRSSPNNESLLPLLVAAIHQLDPDISTYDLVSMNEEIDRSESSYLHRSAAWFMSSLALLAMILGLIGLYGVVTYSVSQRTREIGIRMALGAQRKAILELFLKEFIWLIVIGLGLGLACTFGVSRYVRSFLFGITAYDTSTIVLVLAIVTMATLIATFIPAKRAALVNPVEALRAE
jgi:macrolide transport system ATP-binding/permease protein